MTLAAKLATSSLRLLTVGLDPHEIHSLVGIFEHCQASHMPMDLEQLATGAMSQASEGRVDQKPDLVICGQPPKGISLGEVAQTVRMTFPETIMFTVVRDRKIYDRKDLIKNGFTDAFLFPFEAGVMRRALYTALNRLTNGIVKAYRGVRLSDIKLGTPLPTKLAIYLPVNNKYVHFLNEGVIFSALHLEKLKRHRIGTVYVDTIDMPAFHEYARKNARMSDPNAKMGSTERRHKLEDGLRNVLGGMFHAGREVLIEEGQKTVEGLTELVRTYILERPSQDFATRILENIGEEEDSYGHLASVAVYGALFAIALELGNPADVALAGLLHDIGMVDLPEEVAAKPFQLHNENERVEYVKHVQYTVNVMQEHKLTVTGPVMKAVYQHHEYWDASGFPSNMVAAGISKEAQALVLADQFDYATRHDAVSGPRSLEEMVAGFAKEMLENKTQMKSNPELVRKVLGLLPKV